MSTDENTAALRRQAAREEQLRREYAEHDHLRHVHTSYPRPAMLSPGRITGAVRRLVEWLGKLGPRRQLLGLEPAAPAPYRPHNRARMAQRRARRHMVQASRRANRR